MENASKALLMAGGVIFTILVFSLLLYAWESITNYYKHQEEMIAVEELAKFNSQFTNFERNDIKGYELLTLVNKVIDYNQRYSSEFEENRAVGNSAHYNPITVEINLVDASGVDHREDFTTTVTIPAVSTDPKFPYNKARFYPRIINGAEYKYLYDRSRGVYVIEQWIGLDYATNSGTWLLSYASPGPYNQLLFRRTSYIQNDARNQFKDDVLDVISGLESNFGGSINAQNLVKCISTILEGKAINYNGQPNDEYDRESWYQVEYIENRYKTLTGKNMSIDNIRSNSNINNILRYYEYIEFKKAEFNCIGVTYDNNTGRVSSISFQIKE